MLKVGNQVSVKATYFEIKSEFNPISWGYLTFKEQWNIARCRGTIPKFAKNNKIAHVRWDIDVQVLKSLVKDLMIERNDSGEYRLENIPTRNIEVFSEYKRS